MLLITKVEPCIWYCFQSCSRWNTDMNFYRRMSNWRRWDFVKVSSRVSWQGKNTSNLSSIIRSFQDHTQVWTLSGHILIVQSDEWNRNSGHFAQFIVLLPVQVIKCEALERFCADQGSYKHGPSSQLIDCIFVCFYSFGFSLILKRKILGIEYN